MESPVWQKSRRVLAGAHRHAGLANIAGRFLGLLMLAVVVTLHRRCADRARRLCPVDFRTLFLFPFAMGRRHHDTKQILLVAC